MSDTNSLASRIDAEFRTVEEKVKQFQAEQTEAHQQRKQRLERLTEVFDRLRAIWKPRLELLVKKFEGRVKATPRVVPTTREGIFDFQSGLANVRLKFAAYTDRDIEKLILSYDLEIIPVLMRYKPHDEIEFPLDKVDDGAVAEWIDDRILDFVRTYFAMGENEIYLKDHMVEDPIARVRFPKQAAAATLEWKSQTYHFVSEDTRREFAKQNKIAP